MITILLTVTEFRNNISKYLQLAFKEKVALKSKGGIIELTPSTEIRLNPSPSNDPYFDNSLNLDHIEKGRIDAVEGRTKPWNEIKDKLGL